MSWTPVANGNHQVQATRKVRCLNIVLILYIASVPLISGSEEASDLSKLLGVVLAGIFAALTLLRSHPIKLPVELMVFGAFVGYTLIGGILAREPHVVVTRFVSLFQYWVLTLVIFNLLSSHSRGHILGWQAFAGGTIFAAIVSTVQTSGHVVGRFAGTFTNPNSYGLVLILAIGSLLLIPARNQISVLTRAGALALLVWHVALTGSRKAIIGSVLVLLAYGLAMLIRNIRRPLYALGTVLVIFILGVAVVSWLQATPYWKRVENLALFLQGEKVSERSVYERAALMSAGLHLWSQYPLFGVGADQYRYYTADYGLRQTYSHSNPVEILANFGLLGAMLYYGIYARLSWRLWSAWRRQRGSPFDRTRLEIAAALWVVWVGLELARVSYYSRSHWLFVAVLLSTAYNLERTGRSTAPPRTRHTR